MGRWPFVERSQYYTCRHSSGYFRNAGHSGARRRSIRWSCRCRLLHSFWRGNDRARIAWRDRSRARSSSAPGSWQPCATRAPPILERATAGSDGLISAQHSLRSSTDSTISAARREARDATLAVPKLLLPAIQANLRNGQFGAPSEGGKQFIKIPVNAI